MAPFGDVSPDAGSDDTGAANSTTDTSGRPQSPQDVVKNTVSQVGQANAMLDQVLGIVGQVNTQFPGSKQQAQMIAELLGTAKKQLAGMMADVVKQTSRQGDQSQTPGMFAR